MIQAVKRLNGKMRMVKEVYCDTCETWVEITRQATAAETVGILRPGPQVTGGLFDEPPF